MAEGFDFVVAGLGVLGSSVAGSLAQRGARVLGLDPHPPPHSRGSSHGSTRLIRKAYFEDPRYIPLLDESYRAWEELEEDFARPILSRQGLLTYSEGGDKPRAMREAAHAHGIELQSLSSSEAQARFPGLSLPERGEVLLEPEAGFLAVDPAREALLARARQAGAELSAPETLVEFRAQPSGIWVRTDRRELEAKGLILALGAWLGPKVNRKPKLRVWRAPQFWFPAPEKYQAQSGFPCFAFDLAEGFYYGFPGCFGQGVKAAAYQPVLDLEDPDQLLALSPAPQERDPVERILRSFLPDLGPGLEAQEMCMFSSTPDEDFWLGPHPEVPALTLAGGDSGHAFKFAPALGDAVAEAALTGDLPDTWRFLGWRWDPTPG